MRLKKKRYKYKKSSKNLLNAPIKRAVLSILIRHARWQFIRSPQIVEAIRAEYNSFFDEKIIEELAFGYGLISRIGNAISQLRRDGHPIISGLNNRGYTYLHSDRGDLDECWDDKFKGNEIRADKMEKEKEIDEKLFWQLFNKVKNSKIKQQLLIVAHKYKLRR